ncbi:MAG: DUF4421 family protein [Mangrovibacterium sp.]
MKQQRQLLLGVLLPMAAVLLSLGASSQSRLRPTREQTHALYVEDLTGYLNLKTELYNFTEGFNVTSGTEQLYKIRPNSLLVSKYYLHYRFIALSISFSPKFIGMNDDDEQRGKTRTYSLATRFYFNKFSQELSYSRTKGYYLKNSSDFDQEYLVQFPNLMYRSFAGRTSYQFNPDFSLKAMFDQTERQIRNAGTPIISLGYNYHQTRNPDSEAMSHQRSNNFQMIAYLGYLKTVLLPYHFYLSGSIMAGAGGIHSRLVTEVDGVETASRYNNVIYHGTLGLTLGYDSKRFFWGFDLSASGETYNQGKAESVLTQTKTTLSFHLGYRFNPPKFLKKSADKINSVIPIELE